ncbi:MAG TPA: FtsL-like putative cell division protein [Bacteroidales bacterium]|nr:FtsL-like putative cell division protein [Bacteroidales bacterium]
MEKNEFKPVEPQEQKPVEEKKTPKKAKKPSLIAVLRSILNGEILTRDAVLRLLPFGLFLCLLAVLYIANSYNYEKNIRKTQQISDELIELKDEYITTQSELLHISQQSEIARRLDSLGTGIKESVVPPMKILDQNNKNNKE